MRLYAGLSLTCLWLMACASGPRATGETENYGFKDDLVWVRGPWEAINPSRDVDEVIDQLCPAVMKMPRAQWKDYGQEYCGAIYLHDGTYYASHPSPLGPTVLVFAEKRKACKPPRFVEDPRGQPTIIGDFHSHPWAPSPMSQADRRALRQLWSVRIQFDIECRVMKLVPNVGDSRPGEVFERQGKSWKLIGLIKPEDKEAGIVTPVDE